MTRDQRPCIGRAVKGARQQGGARKGSLMHGLIAFLDAVCLSGVLYGTQEQRKAIVARGGNDPLGG